MATTLSGQNSQALGGWAEWDEGGKKVEVAPRVSCNVLPSSETGTQTHTHTHTHQAPTDKERVQILAERHRLPQRGAINQGRLSGGGGS